MFKDGESTRKWIKQKLNDGEIGTFAVAFWGSGAVEQLGLDSSSRTQPITVICNLKMGGTNPNEIRKLRKLENVTVLQSDRLHGKVYRFNDSALVGSANASANGLSFEGNEILGWHEANLVTSDVNTLKEIDSWVAQLGSRPIEEPDLKAAESVWLARRNSAMTVDNIHNWLRSGPSSFDGRPVFLVAYCDDEITDKAKATSEIATAHYGQKIDWFEDWPSLPKDGILVSFYVKSNGQIGRADGLFERRSDIQALPIADGKTKLELCLKRGGQGKIKKQQDVLWQNIILWLIEQPFNEKAGHGWCKDHGFIELSKVAAAIESREIVV